MGNLAQRQISAGFSRVYAVASHVPRSTYVVRGTDRDSKTLYACESNVYVPTSVRYCKILVDLDVLQFNM